MLKVFGDHRSGNCYKVAWVMNELALPYEWVDVDILAGESRNPEFLALNPNGRIPVVQFSDGRTLAESNAILLHLAEGSPLVPDDAYQRARVYQWLFFEQYSHEPYIATSRFIVQYLGNPADRQADLNAKRDPGYAALTVMEDALQYAEFLTGDHFTVADIALFAYTHVADEGGFDLSAYPAILAWFDRVRLRPGFLPMRAT
ncbi:MAG: glutathione S-transferase family protein [Pseudomonadota bacterium]